MSLLKLNWRKAAKFAIQKVFPAHSLQCLDLNNSTSRVSESPLHRPSLLSQHPPLSQPSVHCRPRVSSSDSPPCLLISTSHYSVGKTTILIKSNSSQIASPPSCEGKINNHMGLFCFKDTALKSQRAFDSTKQADRIFLANFCYCWERPSHVHPFLTHRSKRKTPTASPHDHRDSSICTAQIQNMPCMPGLQLKRPSHHFMAQITSFLCLSSVNSFFSTKPFSSLFECIRIRAI